MENNNNKSNLGALAEWFKAPSWKGGVVKATVSSNLMRSAMEIISPYYRTVIGAFFTSAFSFTMLFHHRK